MLLGGLENALVMTLFPNRSALPRRLLGIDGGAVCGTLKRKLSTGGGAAAAAAVKADEKSANSESTGTAAAGVGAGLD